MDFIVTNTNDKRLRKFDRKYRNILKGPKNVKKNAKLISQNS